MIRTWLKPGQLQLAQPFADRALAHRHCEASGDLVAQINAPPPHNLMYCRIRTSHNQFA